MVRFQLTMQKIYSNTIKDTVFSRFESDTTPALTVGIAGIRERFRTTNKKDTTKKYYSCVAQ